MSDDGKVVLTFKAGPGYEEPWIVLRGETVDEASALLQELRTRGAFQVIREAAAEFRAEVPTEAQAVATVTQAIPGSVVTGASGPAASSSVDPRCPDCSGRMEFKEGSSARGPWRGWFCVNKPKGAKGHVIWL